MISKKVFFCTIYALSFSYAAQSQNQDSQEYTSLWKNESFSKYNIENEYIDLRNENTKHFINGNGDFTAFVSSSDIHYKEEGKWKTIYNSITPSPNGDGFENIHNKYKSFYPKSSEGSITTILPCQSSIKEMVDMKMYYEGNDAVINMMNILSKQGEVDKNILIYPKVYGESIDLRLTQGPNKRKLDYIIRDKEVIENIPSSAEYIVFEESVLLPSGWSSELKNNEIHIYNSENKLVAMYGKPLTFEEKRHLDEPNSISDEQGENNNDENIFLDSNLDSNTSQEVSERTSSDLINEATFEINQIDNKLIIKTKLAIEWLSSENRNFPVVIDPTIIVEPNNLTDRTWTVGDDGYNYGSVLMYGLDWAWFVQSAIRFDLTGVPGTAIVNSTNAYYYQYDWLGGPLNRNYLWTNSANPVTTKGINLYNSMNTPYSVQNSVPPYIEWHMTPFNGTGITAVQNNIGGFLNCGVFPVNTWGSDDIVLFRNHTFTNRPYLEIVYEFNTLPVTFTDFSTECLDDKVLVKWSTASEQNSSHYILERSFDGASWQEINRQDGQGNSNSNVDYQFKDKKRGGVVYYKLTQYDMDGEFEELQPISANCEVEGVDVNLYPNPTNNKLNIKLLSTEVTFDNAIISIQNIEGRKVYAETLKTNSTETILNVKELEKGIYNVQIIFDDHTQIINKRFVVH